MIDAKIEGREIVMMKEEEAEVVDIMTALKASIDQAKESKKPMEKVSQKAKEKGSKRKAS
jgi:DNA end-binding protein Ku